MKKEFQYVAIAVAALLGLAVGEYIYLRYKSRDACDDDCGEEKKEY